MQHHRQEQKNSRALSDIKIYNQLEFSEIAQPEIVPTEKKT